MGEGEESVNRVLVGDCRETLKQLDADSVQMCVTSPPYYGLRNYGVCGQIGLEKTYVEYVDALVQVFRDISRVLRPDGTAWLNIGDSFASGKGTCHNPGGNTSSFNVHLKAENVHPLDRGNKSTLATIGLKPKDLIGIPWRVAFALQADGWYLRSDIIWAKPNPMPESVTDRPTRSHEYLFLLSKSARYYYDAEAIAEKAIHSGREVKTNGNDGMDDGYDGHRTRDGLRRGVTVGETRNRRSVWTIATQPFSGAHFATFPPALIEPCILAGSRPGDIVLDPFFGSGTTGMVAERLGRQWIGCELNEVYRPLWEQRTQQAGLLL